MPTLNFARTCVGTAICAHKEKRKRNQSQTTTNIQTRRATNNTQPFVDTYTIFGSFNIW